MNKPVFHILKTGIVFLLICVLTACSSDDDNTAEPEPAPEELILGKWYFIKIMAADGTIQFPENDCEKQTYYEFEADGTVLQGTYVLDGTECKGNTVTASYELISGGEKLLVTTSDGTANIIEISTLNGKILEIINTGGMKGTFEKR
ncbi:lipocalin-like domain-containing protein [Sinomicrobium soli]|uniref:lipocalin family protein n=1 Tax=Sinomicrobium sp. N-1-3-6 TaxID=2219864 RepID=UPI001374F3F9|nr:lipocalin family protein [Sinomicrobium sp. N-1-3-6]